MRHSTRAATTTTMSVSRICPAENQVFFTFTLVHEAMRHDDDGSQHKNINAEIENGTMPHEPVKADTSEHLADHDVDEVRDQHQHEDGRHEDAEDIDFA